MGAKSRILITHNNTNNDTNDNNNYSNIIIIIVVVVVVVVVVAVVVIIIMMRELNSPWRFSVGPSKELITACSGPKPSLFLAVKVAFKVALDEKIKKKNV